MAQSIILTPILTHTNISKTIILFLMQLIKMVMSILIYLISNSYLSIKHLKRWKNRLSPKQKLQNSILAHHFYFALIKMMVPHQTTKSLFILATIKLMMQFIHLVCHRLWLWHSFMLYYQISVVMWVYNLLQLIKFVLKNLISSMYEIVSEWNYTNFVIIKFINSIEVKLY